MLGKTMQFLSKVLPQAMLVMRNLWSKRRRIPWLSSSRLLWCWDISSSHRLLTVLRLLLREWLHKVNTWPKTSEVAATRRKWLMQSYHNLTEWLRNPHACSESNWSWLPPQIKSYLINDFFDIVHSKPSLYIYFIYNNLTEDLLLFELSFLHEKENWLWFGK